MIKHFLDYFWKMGKPYGRTVVEPEKSDFSYKIIVDPYYRRFSIEKYRFKKLDSIIYDSYLFDFRHLKAIEQLAWQNEVIEETDKYSKSVLRNQDNRAILFETYSFTNNVCRTCSIFSIHGIPVGKQQIFYESFGDSFNGVILYDNENKAVMMKKYEIDLNTGEFSNLLLEEWDMQDSPVYA